MFFDTIEKRDELKCGWCGHVFRHIVEFLSHKSQHVGPGQGLGCEICGTSYTRQIALQQHYKRKHVIPVSIKKSYSAICNEKELQGNSRTITKSVNIVVEQIPIVPVVVDSCSKVSSPISHRVAPPIDQLLTAQDSLGLDACNYPPALASTDMLEEGVQNILHCTNNVKEHINTSLPTNVELTHVVIDSATSMNNSNVTASPGMYSKIALRHKDTENMPDFHFILMTNTHHGKSLVYKNQVLKCLYCDYKGTWKTAICSHMQDKHPDILKVQQFLEVMPEAANEDQKIIRMSEYTLMLKEKSKGTKIRGVEKQDLPGEFLCSKCDKVFNRLRYLRKHLHLHKAEAKYLCSDCGKAFKTQAYLQTHLKTHRQKSAYECKQCSFTSTINAAIHAHRQLHNEGSVLCDICGYAYNDKSTLAKHKVVHDVSRPFACTYPGCTWRFKTEVMCRAHFRAHTTEGKFRCDICGYVFRHKHHLQRHEEKMHSMKIVKSSQPNLGETLSEQNQNILETGNAEIHEVSNTVSLIIRDENGVMINSEVGTDQLDLQGALQNSQLVIATDEDGNTINYEVTDIAMNVAYQTLLQGSDGLHVGDTQAILIPQADGSHIVFHQEEVTGSISDDHSASI
ncbi:hypothetical protein CHS0354_032362 [Potamilus streckersoni]|uniref:C2H2-type domain-containing protein n=1 Tax=Potamilus streckersoni TaxID=2493646 RepID=A0AAE0TGX3_9BIVA|nr:hypothetical protein CHS0354_032362 [Potamilus streckersoni]